jgi:formate hydrogenlyase subunit 3/multisubunit Na+/H+ antiporter MnhD subunit
MYFAKHDESKDFVAVKETAKSLPLSMTVPMLILASLCIIVGIIWLTSIPLPLINHILSNLRMGGTL